MNSLVSIPSPLPTNYLQKKKRREPTSPSTSTSSCSSSSTAVPGPSHQEEHEAATCSGVALGSTSSSHRPTSLSAAAERVASSTGCKVQREGREGREGRGEGCTSLLHYATFFGDNYAKCMIIEI